MKTPEQLREFYDSRNYERKLASLGKFQEARKNAEQWWQFVNSANNIKIDVCDRYHAAKDVAKFKGSFYIKANTNPYRHLIKL